MHEGGDKLFPVGLTVAAVDLAVEFDSGLTFPENIGDVFVVIVGGTAAVRTVIMVLLGLSGAPGEINPGVRANDTAGQIPLQRLHAEAHGGRDTGNLGKPAVIVDTGIKRHDATHAGTADGGAFPEGNGAVFPVNHGFDLVYDPVHGGFSLGIELAEPAFGRIGHIFTEAFISLMTAFNTHHDHGLGPAIQEFLHAPGFAVGGIFVEEQIVAIKKIHDGIPFIGVIVTFRKPDMQGTGNTLGGIDKVAFNDHSHSPCMIEKERFR